MIYKGKKAEKISFPLGGIGTGCIGLAGNGALIDWEIFNRPNKNSYNGYSHFAIKVTQGGRTVTRVLQGDTCESLMGMHDSAPYVGFGFGPHSNSMAGYPHFRDVTFDGAFPLSKMTFADADCPVSVALRAFNPFIPHDAYNSSLAAAFFAVDLANPTDQPASCAVALSVCNPAKSSANRAVTVDGLAGIHLCHAEAAPDSPEACDLCILTDGEDAAAQESWYRGGWQDSVTAFWKQFSTCERLPRRSYDTPGHGDHASLASYLTLAPGEHRTVRFIISWNVPNAYNYWDPCRDESGRDVTWKNYYATQFEDSLATARYAMAHFDALYEKTARFSRALWSSTLPTAALDAISANLSVLKSPTVLRLTDGSLWAWEGCFEWAGSCEGSCQHVWNYAYALPFLFPELERSLRENTLRYALTPSGATKFRVPLPVGRALGEFRACVDGQMGEVIKCYREWKISGDDGWLRAHADEIFRMLDYARSPENKDRWDADCDGVLEGRQHHTLDMELFGPSAWLQGFYLLALSLGAQMADAVGQSDRAAGYRALYERGRTWTNEHLFNGEYFCQQVDLKDRSMLQSYEDAMYYWNEESEEIKYQVADGCIIDQMLADWHGAILGQESIFDEEKKQTALGSLYRYNFKPSMREVTNMWRNFALNDEAGTVICSYPEGKQTPVIPIPYCEECMSGFEYALAGLMLANGRREACETMVRAIRDRYDGEKRNPWNEIECGSNYARSMASYALLPLYSGFTFDMTEGRIGFAPRGAEEGQYLWSVASTWGEVAVTPVAHRLTVLGEPLTLRAYELPAGRTALELSADGRPVPFVTEGNRLTFAPVDVHASLTLTLR